MVTVAVVLIGLAVFAFLNRRSIGPFAVSGIQSEPRGRTAVVATFRVTNQGSREGRSTCQITAVDPTGSPIQGVSLLTRPIPGGGTVSVRHTLGRLAAPVDHLKVACS
jgi:hypothetical protein